jgi:hypothetical protein
VSKWRIPPRAQEASSVSNKEPRMEPGATSGSVGKTVLFWVLFGLGTAVLGFSVLLTQTPGDERTFDVVMLSTAGALLATVLVLGWLRAAGPGGRRRWPFVFVVLCGELLLCIFAVIDILTYRRK